MTSVSEFYKHEAEVAEFMQQCKETCPDEYEEVCKKYPVHTRSRASTVRRRETSVGLLGLSASRISLGVASRNNLEANSYKEDE